MQRVLAEVLERKGWSLRELARHSGVERARVSEWYRGDRSPRVSTLARVLASVGLQIEPELVPLGRELDAVVDEVLATDAGEEWMRCESLFEALTEDVRVFGEDELDAAEAEGREPVARVERVTWAFEGPTALALQGLGFLSDHPEVVAVLDGALRSWLFQVRATPTASVGVSWFSAGKEEVERALAGVLMTWRGVLRLRVVDELPTVLRVLPEGAPGAVPVLTAQEVELLRPDLAAVLVRLRERRGAERRHVA